MGVFGKRLFERSEFPIAAHEAEQHRKQAGGGALLFGYFLLSKQKKVTRLEAKKIDAYLEDHAWAESAHLILLGSQIR